MFDEVTASNLVRVNLEASKTLAAPTKSIRPATRYTARSTPARDEVGCVLHLHTIAGVAVSCQKAGLLPISQQATLVVQSLSYHDYEGLAMNPEEKPRLQANLGQSGSS